MRTIAKIFSLFLFITIIGCNVHETSVTGDSYNFYRITDNEYDEFKALVLDWADSRGFREVSSPYKMKVQGDYDSRSSVEVILEHHNEDYFRLWSVIRFAGTQERVQEINETYRDDHEELSEMIQKFYISPDQV